MNGATRARYRLAAVDIDDTLLGPDKKVSERNRLALAQLARAGCRVVLASGRDHFSMDVVQRELGLDDFLVSSQGALVVHPRTGQQLLRTTLDPAVATTIVERGRAAGFDVLLCTDDGFVADGETPWAREAAQQVRMVAGDVEALAAEGPLRVLWHGAPDAVVSHARLMTDAVGTRAEVVITGPQLLEFTAYGATKAAGVEAVARFYDVDRQDVVAFGDSHNDVSMLRWAGLGVAMPHALAEARAAANTVVPAVDPEFALAVAIETLLL